MKTKFAITRYIASGRKITIPAGLSVVPADNLPASSPIKYWLAECPPGADDEVESFFRNEGFGILASEVNAPGLRAHYENRPIV